jgi:uncharacterized protein (TIGR04255 family)
MSEEANIPLFREPPVDEVAISVQFRPIDGFLDEHIRDYWKSIRDDYPVAQVMPRIETAIESIEPAPVQLPLQHAAVSSRMWLIGEPDDYLVQIQDTRFIQNWRHREAPYPRFDTLRDLFWSNYRKFMAYLSSTGLPQPQVQQVEVTYIDWIPSTRPHEFLKPASNSAIRSAEIDLYPEEQNWLARYLINTQGESIERLYVQCLPAIQPQKPDLRGSQLGFTFRSARSSGLDESEIAEKINAGRVAIVNAFVDLTTETAHESWRRVR